MNTMVYKLYRTLLPAMGGLAVLAVLTPACGDPCLDDGFGQSVELCEDLAVDELLDEEELEEDADLGVADPEPERTGEPPDDADEDRARSDIRVDVDLPPRSQPSSDADELRLNR